MEELSTHDLYEAAYYLLNKCELEAVEATELKDMIICRMIIKGAMVEDLQNLYLGSKAEVNLHEFRRMYFYLSKVVFDTKEVYRKGNEDDIFGNLDDEEE